MSGRATELPVGLDSAALRHSDSALADCGARGQDLQLIFTVLSFERRVCQNPRTREKPQSPGDPGNLSREATCSEPGLGESESAGIS
eukprot:516367-Hanusia_phi.AAC.1